MQKKVEENIFWTILAVLKIKLKKAGLSDKKNNEKK